MIQHLAVVALLAAQAAPVERACITHQEAADMAVTLLPFLLDSAAQRCRPHLAPTSFLNSGASTWSARLREESAPRRESALRGIAKLGGTPAPSGEGGEAAFLFVVRMMTAGMTGGIRPEDCPRIDVMAESLQPLPTDNIARLIVAGLGLGMSRRETETPEPAAEQSDGAQEAAGPPICRS